jgi:signal transduction histidine kinase
MDRDRHSSGRAWVALSCARDGTIVRILRDDLGFAHAAGRAARFADIVDSGSSDKAERLIASLAEREHVAGWQLNVPDGSGARPLHFAGAAADGSLLILGAPGAAALADLFDEVAGANAVTSAALRALLHEQRRSITASMGRDNHLYEELSRLNNELINRERELARKSAALVRVAAEKERMVAIAAHDLRSPLTVISAYADVLLFENAVQGDHLLFVEEISRSARFMAELVEEMLDTSRLESGHVALDLQDLDLVDAARHAATINRLRAEHKQIAITFEQEVKHALIRADAVKLRQIINNLVVNAIKFSPSNSDVTVRVRRAEGQAVLEVEDRGIGIPQSKLTSIFEPFKTLGSSGTAGERSIGLGLTIVRKLADLHRATVEVESEEGRGSLFRVRFPLMPENATV